MRKPHRVLALVEHKLVSEQPLDGEGFRMPDVFNDTSLHHFPRAGLQAASTLLEQ